MRKSIWLLFLALLTVFLLAACGSSSADDPAKAVEAYWQALVAQDSAQVSNLSCAAFESEALNTFESFKSVAVKLSDLACSSSATSDTTASVKCTGSLVASYGTENLTINLADRTYSALKEGGAWRMCGAE